MKLYNDEINKKHKKEVEGICEDIHEETETSKLKKRLKKIKKHNTPQWESDELYTIKS